MQKKIFLTISFLFFTILYGQTYERKWGTMIPIYNKIEKPFSPVKKIFSIPYVTEVNPTTGKLYIVSINNDEIVEYNQKNSKSKLIYKIPGKEGWSFIDNIKFDSNNDIIVCGRTYNPDLATEGSYIKEMRSTTNFGCSFVAKINKNGSVNWFTYMYDIPQVKMALTVDKDDNIYVLNKRFRGDTMDSLSFQKNGDIHSKYDFQDVITKINTNGEHIWSTFYSKDDSEIDAIIAGDYGLYVYGVHIANSQSSTYFGTPKSFMNSTSKNSKNTLMVFLSKFAFDGQRLWSTYFGNEKSYIPLPNTPIMRNPSNIAVMEDNVYFVTSHNTSLSGNLKSIATNNVLLSTPPFSLENHTLSKFSGNGTREWTTYLPITGHLFKSLHNNELFISTSIDIKSAKNIPIAPNSYQVENGGMQDIYTYTISLSGKDLNYSTYYGYDGNDSGFTIPTINGYYTIGYSTYYKQEKSLFATKKAPISKFTLFDKGIYVGNFLGYFSKKVK